jgi:hypothetical protein
LIGLGQAIKKQLSGCFFIAVLFVGGAMPGLVYAESLVS